MKILLIYLLFSFFEAGRFYEENQYTLRKIGFAFFVPFIGLARILDWLIGAVKWIDTTFQIRFFWEFYVTKRDGMFTPEKLERVNNIAKNHFNTNSLKHRMYRFALKFANKKYGPK